MADDGIQDPDRITPEELVNRLRRGDPTTLIDVRLAKTGTIAGAVQVPVTDLEDEPRAWNPDHLLVVFCQYGRGASDYAQEVLREQGYANVRCLQGGMDAYLAWVAEHGDL